MPKPPKNPRFLHATNKAATDRKFILHTRKPAFLAEVMPYDELSGNNYFYSVKVSLDRETLLIAIIEIYKDQEGKQSLSSIIEQLGNWYKHNRI